MWVLLADYFVVWLRRPIRSSFQKRCSPDLFFKYPPSNLFFWKRYYRWIDQNDAPRNFGRYLFVTHCRGLNLMRRCANTCLWEIVILHLFVIYLFSAIWIRYTRMSICVCHCASLWLASDSINVWQFINGIRPWHLYFVGHCAMMWCFLDTWS